MRQGWKGGQGHAPGGGAEGGGRGPPPRETGLRGGGGGGEDGGRGEDGGKGVLFFLEKTQRRPAKKGRGPRGRGGGGGRGGAGPADIEAARRVGAGRVDRIGIGTAGQMRTAAAL